MWSFREVSLWRYSFSNLLSHQPKDWGCPISANTLFWGSTLVVSLNIIQLNSWTTTPQFVLSVILYGKHESVSSFPVPSTQAHQSIAPHWPEFLHCIREIGSHILEQSQFPLFYWLHVHFPEILDHLTLRFWHLI